MDQQLYVNAEKLVNFILNMIAQQNYPDAVRTAELLATWLRCKVEESSNAEEKIEEETNEEE